MVETVAANVNWKKKCATSLTPTPQNWSVPMTPHSPLAPKAMPQPTAHHETAEMHRSSRFFIMMFAACERRTTPASSSAKPACMLSTTMPEDTSQLESSTERTCPQEDAWWWIGGLMATASQQT